MKLTHSLAAGTFAALAAITVSAPASATVLSAVQTQTIASTTTNYTLTETFNKFDTTLGTLVRVYFSIGSTVNGSIRLESLDAASATLTGTLGASVALQRPDSTQLVVTLPSVSSTFNATAYDNVIDFGGTSGTSLTNASPFTVATGSTTAAADLALFSGTGQTIILPVIASGTSSGTGAGNLISQFQTSASAVGTLQFEYDLPTPPPSTVPEPASFALLGAGLLGLAGFARRNLRG